MVSIEYGTHSFVIKIWIEEVPKGGHKGQWRGYITHVNSQDRYYLAGLEDILSYIAPYLKQMGFKLRLRTRILLWFNRSRL